MQCGNKLFQSIPKSRPLIEKKKKWVKSSGSTHPTGNICETDQSRFHTEHRAALQAAASQEQHIKVWLVTYLNKYECTLMSPFQFHQSHYRSIHHMLIGVPVKRCLCVFTPGLSRPTQVSATAKVTMFNVNKLMDGSAKDFLGNLTHAGRASLWNWECGGHAWNHGPFERIMSTAKTIFNIIITILFISHFMGLSVREMNGFCTKLGKMFCDPEKKCAT